MDKASSRAVLALGIALLLASAMTGCSGSKSPDDVVATVNGRPITVGYMELKWAKLADNKPEFSPTPSTIDSLRREVLDVIINKELMVDRAFKEKYVDDPVYQDAWENQKNYRLIELLKNKEVVDKIPEFSEDELLEHYKYVGLSVEARHIDVDTEAEAKAVVKEIREDGLSFADAVSKYSTHTDRDRGGMLGAVSFGSNIKSVEDALFSMAKDEVSDPVQTPYGWSIFIVDNIKEGKQDEYAAVRESIKNRLEMRALREIGGEHAERVLKQYGFKFNWDVAKIILDRMPDDVSPSQAAQSRARTEEKPVLKLTPEELEMVLYELEGVKHTLQEFSDEYDRLHPFARPQKAARLQGIYNHIHKEAVSAVMVKEAEKLGMEQDPEYIMAMKEFEEQSCIGAVRRVLVNAAITMDDAELKAFYDENPLYYTLKPQIRCKQIINAEDDKIQEGYRRLQAGEDIDAVGRDISIVFNRQWTTDWFTADSTTAGDNLAIVQIARLKEVGEYTPPFYYQGYWGIMQLFDTMPARLMDFEEARSRVETDLRETKENARLDSLLAEWRQDVEIDIDDKVLGRVEPGPAPNPNRGRF